MLDLTPAEVFANIIVLLVAFTVHELAHAVVADYLGDPTPRVNGRLTLNPLAHLDPLGSLLLVVAGFGWARPVPINPTALRRRTSAGVMLVSVAGPLSNLAMALLAAIPFRLGLLFPSAPEGWFPNLSQVLTEFVFINLILFLFNLIPIAPLDGDKILSYFLPPQWGWRFENLRPYGPVILLLLVFVAPMLGLDVLGLVVFRPAVSLFRLFVG